MSADIPHAHDSDGPSRTRPAPPRHSRATAGAREPPEGEASWGEIPVSGPAAHPTLPAEKATVPWSLISSAVPCLGSESPTRTLSHLSGILLSMASGLRLSSMRNISGTRDES